MSELVQEARGPGKQGFNLHQQVSEGILEDIGRGKYCLGDRLPSQSKMTRRYNVSVSTIRQSLANLERRGVVRREQGRGCFVSLRAGNSGTSSKLRSVGLIFERSGRPEDTPSELEALLAFANVSRRMGLRLVVAETEFDAHLGGASLMETFDGASLDCMCAYLHVPADAAGRVAVLAREFQSAVAFFPMGPVQEAMPIDCIDVDLRVGMKQLMNYLLSLGHRRIAYVGSHLGACLAGDEMVTSGRWQTYRDELAKAGIPVNTDILVEIVFGTEPDPEVAEAVVNLVRLDNPVTAIFAANDWMAGFVMRSLWHKGIHVPADVSLAGLDDISFAREMVPALTTVAFPFERAAETAIGLMRERLAHPDRPIQKVTLPAELVIRESVIATGGQTRGKQE